jgi:hypothetical protein
VKSSLTLKQKISVSRISGLVLVNAFIFQEILSEFDHRVKSLKDFIGKPNSLSGLCAHWLYIITEIDYHPIFDLSRRIMLNLSSTPNIVRVVQDLAERAERIVEMKAALRHDLMGRVYHRLLADAKYLGTYYTSVPAATLLLKLALRRKAWPVTWHDSGELRKFRIADLACGTGTLLMAAAGAVTDRYVEESAAQGKKVDLGLLQTLLTEDILWGYDVLPSAIHLTASTLALRTPDVSFDHMHLYSLPMGTSDHLLGSIEFLKGNRVSLDLDFSGTNSAQQVRGKEMAELKEVSVPALDLCVMNPPFTRSVGGNLLFGSSPEQERKGMQQVLKQLIQSKNVSANITAGLGSVFVATADPYVKSGGRQALVLPKALLSGVAWGRTRELLSRNYHLEYLIVSHDPLRWNFSENTSLSELLLLAQKDGEEDRDKPYRTVVLNLWRNPESSFEANAVAHELLRSEPPDLVKGQGALPIMLGKVKFGEALSVPWAEMKKRQTWILQCAFAQADLIRAANHLEQGVLWLPGQKKTTKVPLCPLGELGSLGPDRRDIHDGFRLSEAVTPYPVVWGHDAKVHYTLAQVPNSHLSPLPKAKKGRHLRKAEDLWPHAGRVFIPERLRLNTHRLSAIRLKEPALSNVWWPVSFKQSRGSIQGEKALTLWLNSTLGLLVLLSYREETEGAWVDFKKPVLLTLPVLDVKGLTAPQLKALTSAYDELCKEPLKPFPEMGSDEVRIAIDKAIAKALRLPDFAILRTLFAQEPVVCLNPL